MFLSQYFSRKAKTVKLGRDEIDALSEDFQDLPYMITQGLYSLEARQTGAPDKATMSRHWYTDHSVLEMTVRPAPDNTASRVKKISYTFNHNLEYSNGFRGAALEGGTVRESMRVETADGTVYSYGPVRRDRAEMFDSAHLASMRSRGLQQVLEDAEAQERARQASLSQGRLAELRSAVKL